MSAIRRQAAYADYSLFRSACDVYAALIAAGDSVIATSVFSGPELLIFAPDAMRELLETHHLSPEAFDEARGDIEDVFNAYLAQASRDGFTSVRSSARPYWTEPESPETAGQKFDLVAETFDLDALRGSWWVKTTAKTCAFQSLTWEVLAKLDDDDEITEAPVPLFAQISLQLARPKSDELASESVTFAVDDADVVVLIKALERLRNSFSVLGGPGEPDEG